MNKKELTRLEEIAKEKGKVLLIENYQLHIDPKQIEEFPESKLIESTDGEKYKARAIIKKVPTSKFTENLNGRIYPKQLDERLIKDKLPEGTLSLADHPETDGSITRICGVWHNATMDEKYSYGDWYLVGEYGQLIKETIAAGGKVGVSRVGFGEFEEDGKTVKAESYELSRWGDAVIDPSQEVFATFENIEDKKEDSIKENITNKKEQNTQEQLYEVASNPIEEKQKEVLNMNKYDEINLRNHVKVSINAASKKENLREAIEDLKSVEIAPEHSDLIEKRDTAINDLQVKLEEQKKEAESKLEETSSKLDELTKEHDELKEKYEKAKSVLDTIGLEEGVDVEKLNQISLMEENLAEMEKDIKVIDSLFESTVAKEYEIATPQDITDLMEDTIKRDSDIKALMEDREVMQSDIDRLMEDREVMKADIDKATEIIKEAEEAIKEREEKLEKLGFTFEEGKKSKKSEEEDSEEEDDEKEEPKDDEEDEKEEGCDKDKKKDEKKESVEKYEFSYSHGEARMGSSVEDEKTPLVEEVKKEKQQEINMYVDREVRKNSALKDIEKELRKSYTLKEAIEKVINFENAGKDDNMIQVSTAKSKLKPTWLGNRI